MKFHAAYHAMPPVGVNARERAGQVSEMMKLKPQHVAVANDMPTSRMYSGKASAL